MQIDMLNLLHQYHLTPYSIFTPNACRSQEQAKSVYYSKPVLLPDMGLNMGCEPDEDEGLVKELKTVQKRELSGSKWSSLIITQSQSEVVKKKFPSIPVERAREYKSNGAFDA
ncbi:hypothetical protein Tco_0040344 [Tanacetum coccineum]